MNDLEGDGDVAVVNVVHATGELGMTVRGGKRAASGNVRKLEGPRLTGG